jgi:hypothetical protein
MMARDDKHIETTQMRIQMMQNEFKDAFHAAEPREVRIFEASGDHLAPARAADMRVSHRDLAVLLTGTPLYGLANGGEYAIRLVLDRV